MDNMPSQDEQEIARIYCCERELTRPKINIMLALLFMLVFAVCCGVSSAVLFFLLRWLGVFVGGTWFGAHTLLACILLFGLNTVVGLVICAKRIVIGLVRLYQHYAPEEVRRNCMCKPTCSEYVILALEKYGLAKGLRKSYVRLVHTCGGGLYRIDEP